MRKFSLLILGVSVFIGSFASVIHPPRLKASEIFFPVGKTGKTISLEELSKIKIKDLQLFTGHKMDFFDRLNFKTAQRKVRNMINLDGTIDSKKIDELTKRRDGETGFHLGGFALGFFLTWIGVIIAYVINDDYKRNRVKWAWIGFGTVVVLEVILIIALVNSDWY